jgi:hypothetical protein
VHADYGSEHSDNEHGGRSESNSNRAASEQRAASDLKRRSLCEVAEEPFMDSLPVPFVKSRTWRQTNLKEEEQQPLPSSPLSRVA